MIENLGSILEASLFLLFHLQILGKLGQVDLLFSVGIIRNLGKRLAITALKCPDRNAHDHEHMTSKLNHITLYSELV